MRDTILEKGQVFWFNPMAYRKMDGKFIDDQNQVMNSSLMMKTRPYVIVATNKVFDNICTVCPMSSSDSNMNNLYKTFRLKIDNDSCWKTTKPCNFHDTSVIIDQPMTIDVGSLREYIGQLSDDIVVKIDVLLTQYFDITLIGYEKIYKFFDAYFEEKYEEIKEKIIQEIKVDDTSSEKFVSLMIDKMESRLGIKVKADNKPEPVTTEEVTVAAKSKVNAEYKCILWNNELMKKLLDDKDAGFSEQELMELYDIKTVNTLRSRLSKARKALGRPAIRTRVQKSYYLSMSKEDLKGFYNDKKNGMSTDDLKAKYGIHSYATIYRLYKKLEAEYSKKKVKA